MSKVSHGPVLLAQAGRANLTNFEFILEAPWKACRLCGQVYQSHYDRRAYTYAQMGEDKAAMFYYARANARRERWLKAHNRRAHPNYNTELRQLEQSGLPVTPEAAGVLSTYGIIPLGPTPYEDEVADALLQAPRAPLNDVDGT